VLTMLYLSHSLQLSVKAPVESESFVPSRLTCCTSTAISQELDKDKLANIIQTICETTAELQHSTIVIVCHSGELTIVWSVLLIRDNPVNSHQVRMAI
jgi:hypothetical protein